MPSGTTSSGAGSRTNVSHPHVRYLRSRNAIEARFMLERELGGGGMAELNVARDKLLERPVVLKRMRPEHSHEEGLLRLCVEGICLARLHRVEDVLTVYDAFFGDPLRPREAPYLVTEYIEGETLAAFAAAHRPVPGEVVGLMLYALARTLAEVHALAVLHRDVKPANAMVDLEHPGRLVLIDFNVAQMADGNLRLTQKGQRPGSPAYMSPEQTRGWKLDPLTDVFSLGTLGYELLVDRLPFGPFEDETLLVGANVERQVMKRIRRGRYDREALTQARPGYVREVIERCLRVRREERWPSMAALADFLGERLGRDGLLPVREQLGQYVRSPETYAATLQERVVKAARAGVYLAWREGNRDLAEERLARWVEVMPAADVSQLIDGLARELVEREAAAEEKEGEKKAKKGEGEAASAEAPRVPPVPPVGGKGPKAEEREAELKRAEAWLAQVMKRMEERSKRVRRSFAWWRVAAVAAAVMALAAGGVWWRLGAPKGSGEGVAATAVSREEFRQAIGGMRGFDEAKEYAVRELRAGQREVFVEMMRMLDEAEEHTEVNQGLLAAMATSDHPAVLNWILGHMKQSRERRSAHLVAIALGNIAERSFKVGKTPDPRIVPALVRMAAEFLGEGSARIWRPLKALQEIARYQKLAEADLLAMKVLELGEREGSSVDFVSIEAAARILLTNGAALAEAELRARMQRSPHDTVRRAMEKALREHAVEKLL